MTPNSHHKVLFFCKRIKKKQSHTNLEQYHEQRTGNNPNERVANGRSFGIMRKSSARASMDHSWKHYAM